MLFSTFSGIQPTWLDYPDNESLAVEVFMTGCKHGCEFCSNPMLQPVEEPSESFDKLYNEIGEALQKHRTNKVVLVGGEPLLQENNNDRFVKWLLEKPELEVMIYTGYEKEYVEQLSLSGFQFIKCGKYIHTLKQGAFKNEKLMQFASSNQKLYDRNFNLLSSNGVYHFEGV